MLAGYVMRFSQSSLLPICLVQAEAVEGLNITIVDIDKLACGA